MDLDAHFGSNLASKTTPRGTPTRKGGPLILNNPSSIFNGFGPVAVAEGSRGCALKRKTFYNEIQTPKCLQNDSEMDSKRDQNGFKKLCKNCMQKYTKKCFKIVPKRSPLEIQNRAPALPSAPHGHRDFPGSSRGLPGTSFW